MNGTICAEISFAFGLSPNQTSGGFFLMTKVVYLPLVLPGSGLSEGNETLKGTGKRCAWKDLT